MKYVNYKHQPITKLFISTFVFTVRKADLSKLVFPFFFFFFQQQKNSLELNQQELLQAIKISPYVLDTFWGSGRKSLNLTDPVPETTSWFTFCCLPGGLL